MDKPTLITALLTKENSATERTLKRCHSLRRLEQLIASLLPRELRPHYRLGNVRDGTVVIYCDSAAWLARLRYQVSSLLSQLQQQPNLSTIRQIELKVLPLQQQTTPRRNSAALSEHAASCLNARAETVDDPSLRDALSKLARHQKNTRQ